MLGSGIIKGVKREELDGKAYFTIANEKELNDKWPSIINGNPDFIKTYLLFSEKNNSHASTKTDSQNPGGPVMIIKEGAAPGGQEGTSPVMKMEPGLNTGGPAPGGPTMRRMVPGSRMEGLEPELLKKIVEKAHDNNLRVTTHIETATDFRIAVEAGVDEINHLPIPRTEFSNDLSAYVISDQTAKLAATKKITVVATVARRFSLPGGMKPYESDEERIKLIQNQQNNLQTLSRNGVKIVIGSDGFSGEKPMMTAVDEIMVMKTNQYFDYLSILKMATENSAQTIFPNRKIGFLKNGYEASFLVLQENPIINLESIRNIKLRVKQGVILK